VKKAILLISCPDKRGITATITQFIFQNNGNIIHADQHIDEQTNTFFMRVEWSLDGFKLSNKEIPVVFSAIAKKFAMKWDLNYSDKLPKVAIFVSKQLHCLYDLMLRYQSGQLACEIPLIVSNHPYAQKVAKQFGVKFYQFPITKSNKLTQEKKEIALLRKNGIDLIILARYHQLLSGKFVNEYENKIINIHHSFLPAFAGRSPYEKAFRKGVKIIGATSHYVTAKLDQGPIIEQDTVRVSHRNTLNDLIRKGEDLEKVVLSRAVRWYLERKILVYNNKTVIFD